MLLGGWLGAADALAWGFVNRVVPSGTVAAAVEEMAAGLAAGSASANRTVKTLVNRAFDCRRCRTGLELERRLVAEHMRSADAAEGLRAFAEKRKPLLGAAMDLAFSPEQDELVRILRQFARRDLAPQSAEWDRSGQFPWEAWRRMGELGLLVCACPRRTAARSRTSSPSASRWRRSAGATSAAPTDPARRPGRRDPGAQRTEEIGRAGCRPPRAARRWWPSPSPSPARVGRGQPCVPGRARRRRLRAHRREVRHQPRHGGAGRDRLRAHRSGRSRPRGHRVPGAAGPARRLAQPAAGHGHARIGRAVLAFDHVRVPASHRLGEEGTGSTRSCRASTTTASASRWPAWGWPSSRSRRPRLREGAEGVRPPIAQFEGVSFPIAEAATQLEACRWLCYRALWLADQGRPHTKESAMTKWWGPRLAVDTIHQCLLLHGHYGYTEELPFEQRHARRHRARDRRRRRRDHEDDGRPRADGPREPALLAAILGAAPGHPAGCERMPRLQIPPRSAQCLRTSRPTSRAWSSRSRPSRATRWRPGITVIVLESMKMEIPVEAPRAGKVREIKVSRGADGAGGRHRRGDRLSPSREGAPCPSR